MNLHKFEKWHRENRPLLSFSQLHLCDVFIAIMYKKHGMD